MAKYLDRDDVLNVIDYIRTKYIYLFTTEEINAVSSGQIRYVILKNESIIWMTMMLYLFVTDIGLKNMIVVI